MFELWPFAHIQIVLDQYEKGKKEALKAGKFVKMQ